MKRQWLVWLGLGVACAACCAPLLWGIGAAVFAGLSLSGLAAALRLSWDRIVCGGIGVIALLIAGAFAMSRQRRRPKAACDCNSVCDVDACARE